MNEYRLRGHFDISGMVRRSIAVELYREAMASRALAEALFGWLP